MQPTTTMGLGAGSLLTPTIQLIRPLGAGAMGSVWVADHLALHTHVVVKFISKDAAANPDLVTRFTREAAAAAQVKSPHVVQMLDHGVTTEGVPYIVMELLEGRDLSKYIAEKGPLPPAEVAAIVSQISKALRRAHDSKIVHRDIKPQNIFMCDIGGSELFIKVLDFGIAKRLEDGVAESGTRTGAMIGTPYYMSPEQLVGEKSIDLRSDLWSLGVVAFQLLTGKVPFHADNLGALVMAVHSGPTPVPSQVMPNIPPAIDQWFLRACARDPKARFQSAPEMAEALTNAVQARAMTLPLQGIPQSQQSPPMTQANPSSQLGGTGPQPPFSAQPSTGPNQAANLGGTGPSGYTAPIISGIHPTPAYGTGPGPGQTAGYPATARSSSGQSNTFGSTTGGGTQSSSSGSNAGIIALAGLAFLIVVGVGGAIIWKTTGPSSTTTSPTASTSGTGPASAAVADPSATPTTSATTGGADSAEPPPKEPEPPPTTTSATTTAPKPNVPPNPQPQPQPLPNPNPTNTGKLTPLPPVPPPHPTTPTPTPTASTKPKPTPTNNKTDFDRQ